MELRPATAADLDQVLPLVADFYAAFGFPWDAGRKRALLAGLVEQPAWGALWLIETGGQIAGYVLVAHHFSLEFDGRVGLVDEFWIAAPHRGRGIGGRALELLAERLQQSGIRTLRLEVAASHADAAALYARHGFRPAGRELWTRLG
ncbi:MAG TPA: GNAT family N-acetyltransferase [Verrucomicrobiota bacterium]|nr:GNAT family N-acetyltransferase [Verrucomicrobiota bacterium]